MSRVCMEQPASHPDFVSLGRRQLRVWRSGAQTRLLVLPGLRQAARTRADALAALLPGAGVAALELLPLAQRVAQRDVFASCRKAIADLLSRLPGDVAVLACDLAVPLARSALRRAGRSQATLMVADVEDNPCSVWPTLSRESFAICADGTHMLRLWHHLRDCNLLGPGRVARQRPEGYPNAGALHAAFLEFGEDPRAYVDCWNAWRQAWRSEDPLPGEIPFRPDEFAQHLAAFENRTVPVSELQGAEASVREGAWRTYVQTPRGRFHVRRAGERGDVVILLQSAPGSAAPLAPVAAALSQDFQAHCPDFLGNGESGKPDRETSIAVLADDILSLADASALPRFHLWGTHTGAKVALEVAQRAPERVGRIVLDGLSLMSGDMRAEVLQRYLPPLLPDDWGAHLLQAWHMRRDMFLFWPWYRRESAASRQLPLPDAMTLHAWTMGLLQSGSSYDQSYRAAFLHDAAESLASVRHPTLLCAGPQDMFCGHLEAARRIASPAVCVEQAAATAWYPGQEKQAVCNTLARQAAFLRATEQS